MNEKIAADATGMDGADMFGDPDPQRHARDGYYIGDDGEERAPSAWPVLMVALVLMLALAAVGIGMAVS
jgi:hypothetical protein